jgi:hypothetical protein
MSAYLSRLKRLWCSRMHSEIGWPMDGVYQCRKCREVFAVPWSEPFVSHSAIELTPMPVPNHASQQKLAA